MYSACASQSVRVQETPTVSDSVSAPELEKSQLNIDYESLHRSLELDRPVEKLGFKEKSFATCTAGYGYSNSSNCRTDFFVSIYFQLLCRNSEGTVQTALEKHEMFPLSDRLIKWSMKKVQGNVKLDGEGYGQIKMAFRSSQKNQRLKINVGNDFLYLRANEITRVVTPKAWCNQ